MLQSQMLGLDEQLEGRVATWMWQAELRQVMCARRGSWAAAARAANKPHV
jgi:hypothetical protein